MADALRRILEDTDWSTASAEDLRRLVDTLRAREVVAGVTDLHRDASERVLPALPHHVEHSRPHRRALTCARLSPCGRWLATASMPAPDTWDAGGALAVWELASGRVAGSATEIAGGVGWGDEAGDLAWTSRSIVAMHNTNQLGRFALQHGTWLLESDIDLTDGQDHPPPFVVSPDGRHVAVGTWGPEDHGPVARVDLDVGARWSPRDPVPDGCTWTRAAVPRPRRLLWTDRGIVGLSHGVAFRLDPDTLALGWSIALSPVAPTALTRDHLFVATSQLVWVDLTSGEPVGALPLDGEVRGLVPSPHHADRVAVLFDEAVWLVEGGAVRSRLALAPAYASTRRFPDAPAVAFGPDGEVAVRTTDQVVRCRRDGTEVHRHTVPAHLTGLVWGERLVALGPAGLWFFDDAGPVARHDLAPPPGLAEPAVGYDHWAYDQDYPPGVFPLPAAEGRDWVWVVVGDDGSVATTGDPVTPLDDVLGITLHDALLSWPWRWTAADVGAIEGPERPDEPDDAFVIVAPRHELGPLPDHVVDVAIVPLGPAGSFRALQPLSGTALRRDDVMALVGGPVLYAERSEPRTVHTATVLTIEGDQLHVLHKDHRGGGWSGHVALTELSWIGEASWRGPSKREDPCPQVAIVQEPD